MQDKLLEVILERLYHHRYTVYWNATTICRMGLDLPPLWCIPRVPKIGPDLTKPVGLIMLIHFLHGILIDRVLSASFSMLLEQKRVLRCVFGK